MAISTKISIHIAGETLTRFSKLVLHQKVNTHHKFSLIQPLPKEFVSKAIDKAQSYIGQPIKIEIQPNNLKTISPLVFNGIITETQMVRTSGASGGIIINGYSPTIVMEGIPKSQSFSNEPLSDIVKKITTNYDQNALRPTVKLNEDGVLPYTVQYNESDFGFICRLAQKKGQWFYYNGEELVFGEPKSKDFTLEYGRSLHSFNIEMRAKPLGLEYVAYDASAAETQNANAKEVNYQPEGLTKVMYEGSNRLFPDINAILYTHSVEEGSARTHLLDRVTTQLQSRTSDLITAKGDSHETGLRVGDVVSIQEPAFSMTGNIEDSLQEQNFGSYIITDITHVCEESGTYHNTFQAVPESVMSPPYGNVHSHPIADTQPAVITDNNDPKGLGRVQVKFTWQDGNTPWIRMINPHSGSGKGMYFIPEIGEEVLVGFEAGNAEKPFVLGAMYNGNESSSYATSGNDQKVIQTRSGTKIIMNDAKGSVFIEDPSGNTWMMDGKGNISVNAPNDMNFTIGKNFNIVVGENMNTKIGNNEEIAIGNNKNEIINNTYLQSSNDKNVRVINNKTDTVGNAYKQISGETDIQTSKGDLKLRGTTLAVFQGGKDVKVSKG